VPELIHDNRGDTQSPLSFIDHFWDKNQKQVSKKIWI
jgi:hypothetical protein